MTSFVNIGVKLSIFFHFLWLTLFFAYIFGFIGLESAFLQPVVWLSSPIYGLIISILAIRKKVAQVPAILSIIFSISTFFLWFLVLGISSF
ncbi:hypothetical protein [Salinibacillus xinjiangensis]|uniref:Uncharacterized protein n=1 Tax=Salinibacillus xinjiangensis TaxID=1229268 RepID=A0A6G1X7C9_9BACI|nr:hypothetical protein [Salinibacillus xinjiangensis]MRG86911.1 hypothetical protein [Salinibacillus xinjiangensis]